MTILHVHSEADRRPLRGSRFLVGTTLGSGPATSTSYQAGRSCIRESVTIPRLRKSGISETDQDYGPVTPCSGTLSMATPAVDAVAEIPPE